MITQYIDLAFLYLMVLGLPMTILGAKFGRMTIWYFGAVFIAAYPALLWANWASTQPTGFVGSSHCLGSHDHDRHDRDHVLSRMDRAEGDRLPRASVVTGQADYLHHAANGHRRCLKASCPLRTLPHLPDYCTL